MGLTIDDPDFWIILIVGVGLGLTSWFAVAYDGWKKDAEINEQKVISKGLHESVEKLLLASNLPDARLTDLTSISNAELKLHVGQITARLWGFQEQHSDGQDHMNSFMRAARSGVPEDVKESLWRDAIEKEQRDSKRKSIAFQKEIFPDLKAIFDEVVRRVGREQVRPIPMLDLPGLLGPWPIPMIVEEIERHARKLGED